MPDVNANIGSLSLNVKSNTNGATKGLDKLRETLEKLKSISTGKALGLKGLQELANSLSKLKSSTSDLKLSSVATGIEKIKKSLEGTGQSVTNINNLSDSLGKLGNSFKEIGNVSNTMKDLKQSINPTNLDKIMKDAEKMVSRPKKVSKIIDTDNTNELEKPVKKVAEDISASWSSVFSNTGKITKGFLGDLKQDFSSAFSGILEYPKMLVNAFNQIPNMIQLEQLKNELSSYVNEIEKVKSVISSNNQPLVGNEQLVELGDKIEYVSDKIDILDTKTKDARETFKGFGRGIANVGMSVLKLGGAIARIPFNFLKRSFDSAKNSIDNVVNSINRFLTSLARIAMYRAVRAILSLISQGFKEGTDNAYQFSKATGGELAQNLDKIATSLLYVKNSIGAAITPLINAFAPAIEFVSNKFVQFVNFVNQAFAYLAGQDYWLKAKPYAIEYAEAANKATKASKKIGDTTAKSMKKASDALKKATIGIDELNILEKKINKEKIKNPIEDIKAETATPLKRDYTQMFEKVPIENNIKNSLDRIKELIKNEDFAGLGEDLGKKFNNVINSIKFTDLGKKIARWINNGVKFTNSFLKTTDLFTTTGKKLAQLINGLTDGIDGKEIGKLIGERILAVPKFVVGFIEDLDFGSVARFISDTLIGAFDHVSEWFESINWNTFGTTVADKMIDFTKNTKWLKAAQSFGRLIWNIIKTAFVLLPSISGGLLERLSSYVVKKIFGVELDIETKEMIGHWGKMIGGVIAGSIVGGITFGPLGSIVGAIVGGLIAMFLDFFGIHSPSKVMEEKVGKPIAEGIVKGISDTITSLKDTIIGIGGTILNWIGEKIGGFFDKGKEMCDNLGNGISKTYTNIKDTVETWANSIKNWFTGGEGQNNIATKFGTYGKMITKTFGEQMAASYRKNTKDVLNQWSASTHLWFLNNDLYKRFNLSGKQVTSEFKSGVSDTKKSAIEYMSSVANEIKGTFDGIPDEFKKSGEDSMNGYMKGLDSKFDEAFERLKKYGPMALKGFNLGLEIESPSKLFIKSGEYTMEGYDIGIEKGMAKTKKLMEKVSNTLSKYANVDVNFDTTRPDSYFKDYNKTVSAELNGKSNVFVTGFSEGIKEFYKDEILPIINQIAVDTRKQADKEEKTVLQIGSRTIDDVVTTQRRANGYRFLADS